MCLWAIYIFPRSLCLFCCLKYVDRSWEYINRSQTHECESWEWGRAIPRKGIYKWDFPSSVVGVKGGHPVATRSHETICSWKKNSAYTHEVALSNYFLRCKVNVVTKMILKEGKNIMPWIPISDLAVLSTSLLRLGKHSWKRSHWK
jgi:hypothetical protein